MTRRWGQREGLVAVAGPKVGSSGPEGKKRKKNGSEEHCRRRVVVSVRKMKMLWLKVEMTQPGGATGREEDVLKCVLGAHGKKNTILENG